MSSKYEVIIGLEIHVELLTKSKIFCGCKTDFGASPNSQCCPICLGLPGTLPVLNAKAVEYAIRAGLGLNCEIAEYSVFDRKNYFYPDLAKAYQTSQSDYPICGKGRVYYDLDQERYSCGITRAHLEEEAGKLVHSGDSIIGSSYSLVDYNRAGIPLIEIVTEPDLRSPQQAKAFLEQLKNILQYLEVSDCRMEEGSLRCDANISLRPFGEQDFRPKVEIKNLNSFRAVERALEYEVQRQTAIYDQNERVIQETRTWDENRGVTVSMRSKEEAEDYRYFPEPDLVPLIISTEWIEEVKKDMPELPLAKKDRLIEQYALSDYDANLIVSDKNIAAFFEETLTIYGESVEKAKTVTNWLTGEFFRLLNSEGIESKDSKVTPKALGDLLKAVDEQVINGKIAKEVFEEMFLTGKDPSQIIEERGLQQISDPAQLLAVIERILESNQKNVEEYKAGKEKIFGFFVGQVMKETKGKANPALVNQLLKQALDSTDGRA